jgi:flagellar P-ring protein precursor FlgI
MIRRLALALLLLTGIGAPGLADEPRARGVPGSSADGSSAAGENYRGAAYGGVWRNDPLSGAGFVTARIKDVAILQSARDNQLVGYGLVIGLQGTGDGLRSSPFTEQSMRAMLENLGVSTRGGQSRAKNVAAVIVTANLPPFVQSGARIDVNVSSMGDATSLAGGTL